MAKTLTVFQRVAKTLTVILQRAGGSDGKNIHSEELFDLAYGGRKPGFYSSLLAQVIQHGKPGRILDLGAGLGLYTELAHRWGLNVTGLEGSAYAVEAARACLDDLDMLVHDLGDPLPFEDRTVANAVLNQVVEHLDRERFCNVLSESHRVLEHGGRIFVYSPSRRNLVERFMPTHINLMLPSELKNDLELAGFKIVHLPNEGLWFFPINERITRFASRMLLKVLPHHDWVSATSNAIAEKP